MPCGQIICNITACTLFFFYLQFIYINIYRHNKVYHCYSHTLTPPFNHTRLTDLFLSVSVSMGNNHTHHEAHLTYNVISL